MKQLQIIITCCTAILALLLSCNNEKSNEPATVHETKDTIAAAVPLVFDKLTGTWKKQEGNNYERWTKNSDGTYTAVAFSVEGADTSWHENAKVYQENANWVFENTVRGQNNGKAVKFVSTRLTENSVQFTNTAHDFPTDINYTLPDANTVRAFIVGPNKKGGQDTIPFNYSRHN